VSSTRPRFIHHSRGGSSGYFTFPQLGHAGRLGFAHGEVRVGAATTHQATGGSGAAALPPDAAFLLAVLALVANW
jgi:hypothetical protein